MCSDVLGIVRLGSLTVADRDYIMSDVPEDERIEWQDSVTRARLMQHMRQHGDVEEELLNLREGLAFDLSSKSKKKTGACARCWQICDVALTSFDEVLQPLLQELGARSPFAPTRCLARSKTTNLSCSMF